MQVMTDLSDNWAYNTHFLFNLFANGALES